MNPTQYPTQPTIAPVAPAVTNSKPKLFIPLIVVAVVELLVIIVLLVVVSSAKTPQTISPNDSKVTQSQDPQPATSSGVQQTDDSISQDISNLVTDTSFPANTLDDTALSL